MSRFLKFIVHIVVICTTLCVLAMVLPPFWGVTTEIIDTSNKETNLPMGSVTYAIPVDLAEIQAGTPLLVQDGKGFSRYNVVTLDQKTKTATVVDPTKSNSETIPVSLGNKAPKVVITIGFVGYLLVATESIEGLIILGLAVLFLIILYVIAELWKKEPPEEEEEDEDPRAGLVEMLLEYQRLKLAAPYFQERGELGRDIFVKQPEPQQDTPQEYHHTVRDLVRAAENMLRKTKRRVPPPASAFTGIVGHEPVPVEGRITAILRRFLHQVRLPFRRLFEDASSRSEIVATFLAVLELSKTRRIYLEGEGEDMELTLTGDKGE